MCRSAAHDGAEGLSPDGWLPDRISVGVLTRASPPDLVDEVIGATGTREVRRRLLPARLVVYFVLALWLVPGPEQRLRAGDGQAGRRAVPPPPRGGPAGRPAGPRWLGGRGRLHPARRRLPGPPHHPQSPRREDLPGGLRPALPLPPPDRHTPLGLDPRRQPGRDHHRVEQEQDQDPAQPRPTRPRRVTAPGLEDEGRHAPDGA